MTDAWERFQNRVAAEKARRQRYEHDPELIPEVETYIDGDELVARLKLFPIMDAYDRWIGKGKDRRAGSKADGNLVSCPFPGHIDANPSASVNIEENVGKCFSCPGKNGQGGFDVIDVYAFGHGYDPYTYQRDQFNEVIHGMAEALGYDVQQERGGGLRVTPPQGVMEGEGEAEADVTSLPLAEAFRPAVEAAPQATFETESIDWRTLLDPERSIFWYRFMGVCTTTDLPEEFYFWLGAMAVAASLGNRVTLRDDWPVRANLLLCLVGPSGIGKTRAIYALDDLLRMALPFDGTDASGVKMLGNPESAQKLISLFAHELRDPEGGPTACLPVNGVVNLGELSGLMGKTRRQGDILQSTIMEFYDSSRAVSSLSMGHGDVIAEDHFCQMIASTQLLSLRTILRREDDASGFVNRWIFAPGRLKALNPWGTGRLDMTTVAPYLQELATWAEDERSLELTPKARAVWDDFFRAQIMPMKMSDQVTATFTRVELHLKKLMLIFAADTAQEVVDVRAVEQALALYPYLMKMYGFVEESTSAPTIIGLKEVQELTESIVAAVAHCTREDGWARESDVKDRVGFRKIKRLGGLETWNRCLDILSKADEIHMRRAQPNGKSGRPPMLMQLLNAPAKEGEPT